MSAKEKAAPPTSTGSDGVAKLLKQYGCSQVEFTGTDNALYERHLVFDNVVKLTAAGPRERFEAFARSVRDILSQRWVLTEAPYERNAPIGGLKVVADSGWFAARPSGTEDIYKIYAESFKDQAHLNPELFLTGQPLSPILWRQQNESNPTAPRSGPKSLAR